MSMRSRHSSRTRKAVLFATSSGFMLLSFSVVAGVILNPGDPTDALGIEDLTVNNVIYEISFNTGTFLDVFGDPRVPADYNPPFLVGEPISVAKELRDAMLQILNQSTAELVAGETGFVLVTDADVVPPGLSWSGEPGVFGPSGWIGAGFSGAGTGGSNLDGFPLNIDISTTYETSWAVIESAVPQTVSSPMPLGLLSVGLLTGLFMPKRSHVS